MPHKIISPTLVTMALLLAAILPTACSSVKTNSGSPGSPSAQSSPAPSPKIGLEADLAYVRKGQYTYIWVFSRKDGKPLDGDDGTFLKANAPQVVDWVTSDPGKKYVVAGTNFDLSKGNLELLKKRFNAEDHTGK
jgi:hypothetical protein